MSGPPHVQSRAHVLERLGGGPRPGEWTMHRPLVVSCALARSLPKSITASAVVASSPSAFASSSFSSGSSRRTSGGGDVAAQRPGRQ